MHLKYIKLVILKILFVLGLWNFKLAFKIPWPLAAKLLLPSTLTPPPPPPTTTKIKISDPSPNKTISYRLYFLCLSKVWSMLQHRLVWQVQNKKKSILGFHVLFCILFLFFIIKFVFNIFIYFLINYQKSTIEY